MNAQFDQNFADIK